jgi:hypothetical protein
MIHMLAESGRRYFITSTGPIMRAYKEQVDEAHLLGERQQSDFGPS